MEVGEIQWKWFINSVWPWWNEKQSNSPNEKRNEDGNTRRRSLRLARIEADANVLFVTKLIHNREILLSRNKKNQ